MKTKRVILLFAALVPVLCLAQNPLLRKASALRMEYDFKAALQICEREAETDTLNASQWQAELLANRNAIGMTAFCTTPVTVAKQRFSVKDFFLYYPMQDGAWRRLPNSLDPSESEGPVRASYVPEVTGRIIFSAKGDDGSRGLFQTSRADSLWTEPQGLGESFNSDSNEIYPVISADGKTLYFASDGLYGMGGYDLYKAEWNDNLQNWDAPVNMGFPYSSPYDDFLLMNTDDGKYTVFASNRECSRDSVVVYVLKYDTMPVHTGINDIAELKRLASLDVISEDSTGGRKTENTRQADEYGSKLSEVEALREEIRDYCEDLEFLRAEYAGGKTSLKEEILHKELALPGKRASLDKAVAELQDIEIAYIRSGKDIHRTDSGEKTVAKASSADKFTFTKHKTGGDIGISFEKSEPEFDYSFQVLPKGQFAENNTLPAGLVYQIQIFVSSRKATENDIKGLSPVFERLSGGKRVYLAGLFKTYRQTEAAMPAVKKAGFKSAMIKAFNDGKSISLSEAKELEAKNSSMCKLRIFPSNGQSLPEAVLSAIHQNTDKDISRSYDNGAVVFEVGPFDDEDECSKLGNTVSAAGESNVSIIKIKL